MHSDTRLTGSVAALWRYPVKSMQGEQIDHTIITSRGILGDRVYAIMDRETGHIASAKYPRKWSNLLSCRATFAAPPQIGKPLPPIWITLPNGEVISSADAEVDQALSDALGRDVTLVAEAPAKRIREADRTSIDAPIPESDIRKEPMASPAGTFFDYAVLHVVTTSTLDRFQALHPSGRFDVRRFRPNIVVAPDGDQQAFVENHWLGHVLAVGEKAHLHAIDPCPRCVMTTLAQADLPRDPSILRAVTQHNAAASVTLAPGVVLSAVAGMYANVLQEGVVRQGDPVRLQ